MDIIIKSILQISTLAKLRARNTFISLIISMIE